MDSGDRAGDGQADTREVLFTGFPTGELERGINAPQRNVDGWIYFGRGWGGGKITGPHLPVPVDLPGSDFRIRADGGACGPVVIAGPTCDSADILYEKTAYRLPLSLKIGDKVRILAAGAYTST